MCEQLNGSPKGREPERCICPKTTGVGGPKWPLVFVRGNTTPRRVMGCDHVLASGFVL